MSTPEEFTDSVADMLMQFLPDFKTGNGTDDKTGFPIGHGAEDAITDIEYEEGDRQIFLKTAKGEVWMLRPVRIIPFRKAR